MVAIAVGGLPLGIANDLDLGSIMVPRSLSPPITGHERTGLQPFMAAALLLSYDGSIERLYRHDLESILWSMVWYLQEQPNWARGYFYLTQSTRIHWVRAEVRRKVPVGLDGGAKLLWPKVVAAAYAFVHAPFDLTDRKYIELIDEAFPCPIGLDWVAYDIAEVVIRDGDR
jgi:Fungal protein kinase